MRSAPWRHSVLPVPQLRGVCTISKLHQVPQWINDLVRWSMRARLCHFPSPRRRRLDNDFADDFAPTCSYNDNDFPPCNNDFSHIRCDCANDFSSIRCFNGDGNIVHIHTTGVIGKDDRRKSRRDSICDPTQSSLSASTSQESAFNTVDQTAVVNDGDPLAGVAPIVGSVGGVCLVLLAVACCVVVRRRQRMRTKLAAAMQSTTTPQDVHTFQTTSTLDSSTMPSATAITEVDGKAPLRAYENYDLLPSAASARTNYAQNFKIASSQPGYDFVTVAEAESPDQPAPMSHYAGVGSDLLTHSNRSGYDALRASEIARQSQTS